MNTNFELRSFDFNGLGPEQHRTWTQAPVGPCRYWEAVTDVPCPVCDTGRVRWAEAGRVPGSRECDGCGAEFQAVGDTDNPALAELNPYPAESE